jgi:hypothetical protein
VQLLLELFALGSGLLYLLLCCLQRRL